MKILNFPELRQTYEYDCGASATQSVLAYYGFDIRERDIMTAAGTNTKHGTPISGIERALAKHGLKFRAAKMTVPQIKKYIDKKIPVILLIQAWVNTTKKIDWIKDWKDGHYVVAIGYDQNHIYFEDPAAILRTFLSITELQKRWHDVDSKKKKYINFGIAVWGKKPSYKPLRAIHMG